MYLKDELRTNTSVTGIGPTPLMMKTEKPTMPPAKTHFYIPCLDGIRALAVLLVIVAHSGFENFAPGGFGVTIFFFLSGFLITTLLRIEGLTTGTISIRDFYLRRIYRILPPMYATIFIVCGLAWFHLLTGPFEWRPIVLTSVFFTNYLQMFKLGSPPAGIANLWSLAVEEHFYFIFPIAYALLVSRKVRRLWQSVGIGIACLLVLLWRVDLIYFLHRATGDMGRIYPFTDTRIDSILYGCLLAIALNPLLDEIPQKVRDNAGKLGMCGLGLIGLTLAYRNELFRDTFRYSIQGIGLTLIFLFVISSPTRLSTRWLENPLLRYIGRRSYVLYLIHFAIAVELTYTLHLPNLITLPLSLALSLAYAELMNRLVEEPMRKLKKKAMRSTFHVAVTTPEDAHTIEQAVGTVPPAAGAA